MKDANKHKYKYTIANFVLGKEKDKRIQFSNACVYLECTHLNALDILRTVSLKLVLCPYYRHCLCTTKQTTLVFCEFRRFGVNVHYYMLTENFIIEK